MNRWRLVSATSTSIALPVAFPDDSIVNIGTLLWKTVKVFVIFTVSNVPANTLNELATSS